MHKFIRRSAAAILAASMLLGNSMTALASQDDSNYGPAFATNVSTESPAGSETVSYTHLGQGVEAPA